MQKILNGKWLFKQSDKTQWLDASVPGCNFLDLMDNNLIDDPFIGLNEKDVAWVGEKDFEYKKLEDGRHVYDLVGDSLSELGRDYIGESGYSSIGLVIGGTHTEEATAIRAAYPQTFFLIPGYGAQGGKAADIAQYMNNSNGGVVNSSRGILLAYKKQPGVAFDEAAYNECVRMKEDIQGECNKL